MLRTISRSESPDFPMEGSETLVAVMPPPSFPVFHIGVRGPVRSQRQRQRQRQEPAQESSAEPLPPISFDRPQRWLLVPARHVASPDVLRIFEFIPYGFVPAYRRLRESGVSAFPVGKFRLPRTIQVPQIPFTTKGFHAEMWNLIRLNQKIRWAFKRLIQRWRCQRLRQVNTEDVVTMEKPKQPVYIYDWAARTKYVFEASSLFRGIKACLTLHHDLIPTPKAPINPFTNQPLTLGQLHFTLAALRAAGYADWTTEMLRVSTYEIDTFKRRANTQLRVSALKHLFADTSDEGYVDLLYDFIDFCHDDVGAEMVRKDVWEWMIQNRSNYIRIQTWRGYCYQYYHGLITESSEAFASIKRKIMRDVEELVALPMVDMILQWKKGQEWQKA
jgi:hypothetical protein